MSEKMFKINGIDICQKAFGNPKNPANFIIMGATCSHGFIGTKILWAVG